MNIDFRNAPSDVNVNNLEAEITRWRNATFAQSTRAEAALALLRESQEKCVALEQKIKELVETMIGGPPEMA